MLKRKICVVVTARPSYSRIKTALTAIKNHPKLELQLVIAGSALLGRYGNAVDVIEKDGFVIISKLAPDYASLKISVYGNYNGGYELLRSDKYENLQTIEKAYKLEKGSYKIVMSSDNNEYIKFINN